MLNFDNNHSYVEGNVKNKKGTSLFKKIVLCGLIIANIFTFSGCVKSAECDVPYDHAHYYVNSQNIGRYIESEKLSVSGLERLDAYIEIDQEDAKLIKFLNKHDLFKISDNQESIDAISSTQEDYLEYRYKYHYLMPIPMVRKIGKTTSVSFQYIPTIGHSWTTEQNHKNLTGETRVCHHVYYGYKITMDEKGKYKLTKSEPVDDIHNLPPEYEYIKEEFYSIINLETQEELDYEDGKEEDYETITEQEYHDKVNKEQREEMMEEYEETSVKQENEQGGYTKK